MKIKNLQLISISLFFFSLSFLSPLHAQNKNESIKIGVRAHSGTDAASGKWSTTAKYLSQSIEGYYFKMVPLIGFAEMEEAVQNNNVQFVLINPATYIELEQKLGIARISTLIDGRGSNATKQLGGFIFTRADRSDTKNNYFT